jgi:hypothetical protein
MKVYELLAASGRPGNDGDGTRAYLSVPVWLAVCLHARDKMHACPAAACPFGILDTVRCKRNATQRMKETRARGWGQCSQSTYTAAAAKIRFGCGKYYSNSTRLQAGLLPAAAASSSA